MGKVTPETLREYKKDMCGILGIAGPLADIKDDESVSKALKVLHHRGPDDNGLWRDKAVVLAHTRLSILDLSKKGHQPMISSDGRYVLVYNGEIYNFPDLKAALLRKGVCFQSTGDTEVLLAAMVHWGLKTLHKLNGMFAFAFYDSQAKELILARDRFGVKPLFYEKQPNGLVFASEIKALRNLSGGQKLNPEATGIYFTLGYNYAPLTIWQNVYRLPPAHLLRWRNGKLEIQQWYHSCCIEETIDDWETAKAQLENNLEEAVRIRLVSDVPVGAFLSGGVDSSIVVGLMRRVTSADIKTFTATYKGVKSYDESTYARLVAEKFGTRHTELQIETDEVKRVIPEVLDSLDEPFADPSILPTYLICREIRKHVTVALSGDGADEVFAGYRKYLGEYYMNRWWLHLIYPWAKYIADFLPASRRNFFTEYVRSVKRFSSGVDPDPINRHLKWMTLIPGEIASNIVPFAVSASNNLTKMIKKKYEDIPQDDRLNKILHTDQSIILEGNMLPKIDMMSMLNSLEVRSPFMDYRVICLANSMPGKFKLKDGKGKVILRDMFKGFLPEETLSRDKQGFDVPIGEWFQNEYKDMFWDITSTASRKKGINLKPVESVYKDHISEKEDNSRMLWSVFVWSWWWSRNF